jgi:hypothetical protein
MAHYAAELIERVRYRRMLTKRLYADVHQSGFFLSDVTGGAAIDYSEIG